MEFSEKLVILMEITKTSNKALANYLYVDPSMISQFRTGRRAVTKKRNHLDRMAEYFATHCTTNIQRSAILEYIGADNYDADLSSQKLAALIYHWLSEPEVQKFSVSSVSLDDSLSAPDTLLRNCSVHVQRKMLASFYEYVLSLDKICEIYFISDETAERNLANVQNDAQFQKLIQKLLEKGHHFTYILNPDIANDELVSELLLNVPRYLSGQISCYYYPRFSDDIFRRTLIVIPETIAFIASSRKNGNNYYVNFTTDPTACSIACEKVMDYLAHCKPSITTYQTQETMMQQFFELLNYPTSGIAQTTSLSPFSMPLKQMVAYMKTSGIDIFERTASHYVSNNSDYAETDSPQIIELCHLSSLDDICSKKVLCPFPSCEEQTPLYYTPELYLIHLQNIHHLLVTSADYKFYDISEHPIFPFSYIEKAGSGALIFSSLTPHKAMYLKQPNIVQAAKDYVYQQCEQLPFTICDRAGTIAKIEQLIHEFTLYCQNSD